MNNILVLNTGWQPIGFFNLKKSINLVLRDRAKIIHPEDYRSYTWADWAKLEIQEKERTLKSTSREFKFPEIIILVDYSKMPPRKMGVSRRALYARDENICQYCNKKFHTSELSIDHIIPKSKGGNTTFQNCVCSCTKCNGKKANKTLEEAHMKLIREPKEPKLNILFNARNLRKVNSWSQFLGEMYWQIPLD